MKFTLEFEAHEVDILAAGLGKMPLEVAVQTWNKLIAQVETQKAAPPKLEAVRKADSHD